jgi:hypothetical protein
MLERRRVLQGLGSVLTLAAPGARVEIRFTRGAARADVRVAGRGIRHRCLDALPGKQPLIKLSYRPPNYETPVAFFSSPITRNDAFFVRYHLADIPSRSIWRAGGYGSAAMPLRTRSS